MSRLTTDRLFVAILTRPRSRRTWKGCAMDQYRRVIKSIRNATRPFSEPWGREANMTKGRYPADYFLQVFTYFVKGMPHEYHLTKPRKLEVYRCSCSRKTLSRMYYGGCGFFGRLAFVTVYQGLIPVYPIPV
ncbi:uncharacterized protein CC84DRAFT_888760 [Paraphaeosphaeria sporulosa]|uniref:Uncharacterized protein n=1 Tax=Paraphaeosphaeria sporulosa TaxID=1460663 RepID=A0A177CAG1_9PLEO|nr:uncharacterized protein CC84DRAFT_888760 [Paraphaeosphaeria sporulosa]OAG04121.1 hypothetical protein CC84DRAFT_888760 [Paraphaeosphaeria sporulosa]